MSKEKFKQLMELIEEHYHCCKCGKPYTPQARDGVCHRPECRPKPVKPIAPF